MIIKRELTPRELEFFKKFRDLFIEYNAIISCDKNRNLCVVVDIKSESDLLNTDISFDDCLDETDIDELFEGSRKLHNTK